MPLPPLGSHMSIAGGVDKAPARGASVGSTAMQIFVKNNNRWQGPPISAEQAKSFRKELDAASLAVEHVFAHTCYLINLASPNPELGEKSVEALKDELLRCEQLGLPGLVMHPGSHVCTWREGGIERIVALTQRVIKETPKVKTRILFETTAGTGSNLGGPFEDIGEILRALQRPDRVGVCMDTCHIFSAGYDIRTADTYKKTMSDFEREIGFSNLRAVHLNDSKQGLASRKDRHEHIGKGLIGEEAFRLLMRDARFAAIPMSLETEKDEDLTEDRMNLETLRRLAAKETAA
ncbi:deoxyribonuclease IV [soil metagenome]